MYLNSGWNLSYLNVKNLHCVVQHPDFDGEVALVRLGGRCCHGSQEVLPWLQGTHSWALLGTQTRAWSLQNSVGSFYLSHLPTASRACRNKEENRGLGYSLKDFILILWMKISSNEALSQNPYLTLFIPLAKSVIMLMKLWTGLGATCSRGRCPCPRERLEQDEL